MIKAVALYASVAIGCALLVGVSAVPVALVITMLCKGVTP